MAKGKKKKKSTARKLEDELEDEAVDGASDEDVKAKKKAKKDKKKPVNFFFSSGCILLCCCRCSFIHAMYSLLLARKKKKKKDADEDADADADEGGKSAKKKKKKKSSKKKKKKGKGDDDDAADAEAADAEASGADDSGGDDGGKKKKKKKSKFSFGSSSKKKKKKDKEVEMVEQGSGDEGSDAEGGGGSDGGGSDGEGGGGGEGGGAGGGGGTGGAPEGFMALSKKQQDRLEALGQDTRGKGAAVWAVRLALAAGIVGVQVLCLFRGLCHADDNPGVPDALPATIVAIALVGILLVVPLGFYTVSTEHRTSLSVYTAVALGFSMYFLAAAIIQFSAASEGEAAQEANDAWALLQDHSAAKRWYGNSTDLAVTLRTNRSWVAGVALLSFFAFLFSAAASGFLLYNNAGRE